MLKPRGKKVLNVFLNLVGIAFGVIFLVISYRFVTQIQATNQVSATIGNVPMYLIYMCFPISFVLYIIRSAEGVVRNIKSLREGKKGEAA
jgi:TRAP-type C4-dicarboxylate transport system permease small subunit